MSEKYSKAAENILRAFNYDVKLALEQYLTACEIANLQPNPFIVNELGTWMKK